MARYGIDFYGGNTYGSPSFIEFDASPLEVLPFGPAQNQLHWSIPSGNWTRLRLVRNAYGWPVHEDDGVLLLDLNMGPSAVAPVDAPVNDFIDEDLQPGRLYYYSIFVLAFDDTNLYNAWRHAAEATAISVGKWSYTERMLDLLPEVYWADPSDPSGRNQHLVGFLDIFGFQLDQIRSQYETLRYVHDPDKVAAGLLGPLGDMFGVSYDPEIGARQYRAMVRNAVYIAKRKGTLAGTNTLVSSFTGWDAAITVGKNLMLDYNDSSGEECAGRWEGRVNCTVAWRAADNVAAAWQSSVFANLQGGMLLLTAKASGDVSATLGLRKPIVSGVPITASSTYTFSGYFQPLTVANRPCSLGLTWHDARGQIISGSTGSTVPGALDSWVRATVTDTAPANAVYASFAANAIGLGAAEQVVMDALQFEVGGTATEFQEARDIRITLTADRINELPNPSAEVDLTGWTGAHGTLARSTTVAYSGDLASTTPTTTVGSPNVASFTLTPTTSTPATSGTATTGYLAVTNGQDYTASAYLYGSVNGQLQLSFYASDYTLLSTTTGQSVDWVVSRWVRADVTATAPDNAAYAAVTVVALWSGLTSPQLWFDQVLVERSAEIRPYFDASQYGARPADNLWEGSAHASRSHHYFNRVSKTYRLDALLEKYTFPIRTHTLLVAQPFTPAVDQPNEDISGTYGTGPYGGIPYI